MTKGGTLIRIQLVMRQLAMGHPTDGVNEVAMIQVFEPVLVRIMGIGATIKLVSRRVFNPILIMSVLGKHQDMCNNKDWELTRYSSSLNMNGVMARP